LGLVLALFLIVVWLARRAAPQSATPLPADAVQVLGRVPLVNRHVMQLVRVGNKLILVALTQQGAATLTEITEPAEVERLCAACERQRPGSITATFRHVLHQFADERAAGGFLGQERDAERRADDRSADR
jgi:flagellar biogenesis protein FliO